MLHPVKDKKPHKSSSTVTSKQQALLRTQQLLTARIGKSSSKNYALTSQQKSRSPEMIKLMIDQLQRQLLSKTKSKDALQHSVSQLNRTRRNPIKYSKQDFQNRATLPLGNASWKSPNKKKRNKNQQCSADKKQVGTKADIPQKSSSKNHNHKVPKQSSEDPESFKKTCKTTVLLKKSLKKSRDTKENYIFFNNDLIRFSDQKNPLFIIESNSKFLQNSELFSSRNENDTLSMEKKHSFMAHSKIPSFDSVNTKAHKNANFIERSFCEDEFSQEENEESVSFFQLNLLHKKIFQNSNNQSSSTTYTDKFQQKNQNQQNLLQTQKIDINRLIQLNDSVIKIQKWWRKFQTLSQLKNQKQQHQAVKQSKQTIETKEQSQKNISEPIKEQHNCETNREHLEPQSVSEKKICSTEEANNHTDILKLRQNAAYLQFSTHQKILKELLTKSKITPEQFEQKLEQIKHNLTNELKEIAKIREILKQSAQKVETIMKKTKHDILTVKSIVSGAEQQNAQGLTISTIQQLKNPTSSQIPNNNLNNDILSSIFGQQRLPSPAQNETFSAGSRQIGTEAIQSTKKPKPPKRCTYQTQLEEFANQDSDPQAENSFIACQNSRVFNSPTSNSLQSIPSPQSKNHDGPSSQEILEEQTQETQSPAPQNVQAISAPFPITANFEQLFKQYQEQQHIKKQIESRIAKQLGLPDPEYLPRTDNQNQIHITTSIVAIHKFLLNFFKFYLYYHKNEFLTHMNMPYGESIETRLAKNKLKHPEYALEKWTRTSFYTEDDQEIIYGLKHIIPESVLEDFFESYYEQTDIEFTQVEKTNIELEKIHNRAVFEAFNEGLNFFRPYFNIEGAPYLWCSSEKSLTFFCIGEDNIQQVYEKTQMKILKMSSHLCGVIADAPHKNKVFLQSSSEEKNQNTEILSPFKVMENESSNDPTSTKTVISFQEFLKHYPDNFNPAYLVNLQERLKKKELAQTEQENLKWFGNTFEEGKVSVLLNLTELIEEIILLEECSILKNIHAERLEENHKS